MYRASASLARVIGCFVLATMPTGCVAYGHSVSVGLRDPRLAWVESTSTQKPFEPPKVDEEVVVPGTGETVERAANGAISVQGHTIVASDGAVLYLPRTLAYVAQAGDTVRIPICFRWGCDKNLIIATATTNVRVFRERDRPLWFVGVAELLFGAGFIVGGRAAWSPKTSGGAILVTGGVLLGIIGVIQLASPGMNDTGLQ